MIDDLPPLREVIARHELAARKSLGQNFLLDLNVTNRIARLAGPFDDHTVIEVGPGPGGLTRALLAQGAMDVFAIERDRRCIPALTEISERYPGRLRVIEGDAVGMDLASLAIKPVKIVANLPYNIATKLLVDWVRSEPWPPFFRSMTLMFQKEVAERICAPVATEAYGRLAVLSQWRTRPVIVMRLPARAFTPAPKVESAVVQLVPILPVGTGFGLTDLEAVTEAAFGQRRKMLRSSLKQLGVDPISLLAHAGIDPQTRAERLSVAEFAELAQAFAASKA